MARVAAYAAATFAGLLSLAAAGYSAAMQIGDSRLLTTRAVAQIAPIPAGMPVPAAARPPVQSPLDEAERRALGQAIWRDPLEPKFFNLFYADSLRTSRPAADIRRQAGLLSSLGWRYTPAQQNLMMQAILAGRFVEVVDRVDALLRRQKLPASSFAILMAMEALPQVHHVVVDRLRTQPSWRRDYLSVINPQTAPDVLTARIDTLDTLLRSPAGMSREEIAPSLAALVATGHGGAAYRLWVRRTVREKDGNLVYDPGFQQALAYSGAADLGIPFEWRFGQDLGYAAQASANGVAIDWDRRGVPVFLSQVVPVEPGEAYTLTLSGRSDTSNVQSLLMPAIVCAGLSVQFARIEGNAGEARYRSDPLPQGCRMGTLTVNGMLDTGSGPVSISLTRIALQRAR